MAKKDTESAAPPRPEELQAPGYEIFIGLLAVISLINLALTILRIIPPEFQQIAEIVDIPITIIFLADFTMRLRRSHPRRTYFIDQRGWLDLLGSLPSVFCSGSRASFDCSAITACATSSSRSSSTGQTTRCWSSRCSSWSSSSSAA